MSVAEGHDFGDTTSTITMDDHITLNAAQAEGLRALYGARKELENRIAFAEQMIGIQGREVVSGDLGDESPHLILKAITNGASG